MNIKPNTINIAEPCSQSWAEMEQGDGSRFCQACNKCVIDFSSMHTSEIFKKLLNADEEICGRISRQQLDALNHYQLVEPVNRQWMKYLGVLAIGISVLSYGAEANTTLRLVPQTQISNNLRLHNDDEPEILKIYYGYMFSSDKKPLAGLKLRIQGTQYTAITDQNGRYEFKLDDKMSRHYNLIVSENATLFVNLKINFQASKQVDYYPYKEEHMILGKIALPLKKEGKKL